MKKNLSFVILICIGIGIGVLFSKLSIDSHSQDFIPNQYEPTKQNLNVEWKTPEQIAQEEIQKTKDMQESSQIQIPQKNPEDGIAQDFALNQDIFNQEKQIPQFQTYTTDMYNGAFFSADESCINCDGGPQEALKKGIIDFGGKYIIYTLKPNNGEILVGAVNVENGEILEFPIIYKEVTPPFNVVILSKADSNLIWIKGIDSKNTDVYTINAYVLQNDTIKKIKNFEISIMPPETLDSQFQTYIEQETQDLP